LHQSATELIILHNDDTHTDDRAVHK